MALVVFDRVKETSNTSGTGTIVLAGAVTGYQSFAVVGNANTTYYTIADQSGSNWEVGIGTYYTGNVSLARTTILSSSNANAAVNFTNATHDVFITYPAEKAVYLDSSNNAVPSFGTFTGAKETLIGTGQNFLLQSQTFTTASWTNNLGTVTASAGTAPDGTNTATNLIPSVTSSSFKELQQNITVVQGITYTYSGYFKQNGYQYIQLIGNSAYFGTFAINYDLSNGTETFFDAGTSTVVARDITSVGNGWYRVYATVTALTSATLAARLGANIVPANNSVRGVVWTPNGTSSILAWGYQIEVGTTANTYIPTTTTAIYGTPTLSFSGVANVTLDSSGTMNLSSAGAGSIGLLTNGGANTQALIAHTANAVNYVQLTGAGTGGAPTVSAQGADSTAQLALTSKGATSLRFYTNTLAAEQFRVSSTTSAVNYAQVTGGATGANVTVSAQGSDTNVGVIVAAKGTGSVYLQSGSNIAMKVDGFNAVNYWNPSGSIAGNGLRMDVAGSDTNISMFFVTKGAGSHVFTSGGSSGTTQFRTSATASAVNYIQVAGAATGGRPTISAQGSDTNIDVSITPKGTGFANITSGGVKFPDGTTQTTASNPVAGNSSIIINNVNITSNATIAAGQNGFSVGPITTANGVSVTVASGQQWVVI